MTTLWDCGSACRTDISYHGAFYLILYPATSYRDVFIYRIERGRIVGGWRVFSAWYADGEQTRGSLFAERRHVVQAFAASA